MPKDIDFIYDLRDIVIRPVLMELKLLSDSAVNLLLGTAAVESGFRRLVQEGGPALGIYQMEPTTASDVFENVIIPLTTDKNPSRRRLGRAAMGMIHRTSGNFFNELTSNLRFATLMARMQYWRFDEPLPSPFDIEGLARYWKTYWNTLEGKGSIEDFIRAYDHFNLGVLR